MRSSTLEATLSLISSSAFVFSRASATSTKSRMICAARARARRGGLGPKAAEGPWARVSRGAGARLVDVLAHKAHLGELSRFDLDKRRARQLGQAARHLGLPAACESHAGVSAPRSNVGPPTRAARCAQAGRQRPPRPTHAAEATSLHAAIACRTDHQNVFRRDLHGRTRRTVRGFHAGAVDGRCMAHLLLER